MAFRDDGVALFGALVFPFAPPGDVNWDPTVGNWRLTPFMVVGPADHSDGVNCGLKNTGAPLYPMRASLTRLVMKFERTQLLNAMRFDS